MSSTDPQPCPTLEEIESRLAVASDGAEESPLAEHLDHCEVCRASADRIRANNDLLKSIASSGRNPPPGEPPRCDLPAVVPGFEVLAEIRRGGQGVVYRAMQIATKREVALKMLLSGRWASERQRRRFEREIELVASLRHPRIVTLYESGRTQDGGHYFAMEFVDGQPLDVGPWISPPPARPHTAKRADELRHRLALFCNVCDAVQHAHRQGVIHRDLKPGNILVDVHGEPHVLDFGVARAIGDVDGLAATHTGEFVGTFAYAAPEQVSGTPDQVDTRTDVYSLGVILYEMLCGSPPYPRDNSLSDVVRNITQIVPPPPSRHAPEINDELDTIVLKALAKEKDRRYPSVEALGQDVERYLSGEPIDAKRDSTWYVFSKMARRYRVLVGATTGIMLLLAVIAVAMAILAGQVRRERDRANANAGRLFESINALRIETGRTTGAAGDAGLAEETLWRVHLNPPSGWVSEPPMELVGAGGPSSSFWALWELYSRAPGLATWAATQLGHCALAFSGDAGIIAMACHDGQIRIWDMTSASIRSTVSQQGCQRLSLSPDGSRLGVIQHDGTVDLWETEGPNFVGKLTSEESLRSISFGPDGNQVVVCSPQGLIQIWEIESLRPTHTLRTEPKEMITAAFWPDGSTVAVLAGADLSQWHPDNGALDHVMTGTSPGRLVAVAPDGKTIAAAFTKSVHLVDPKTGASWNYVHGGRVSMMQFSPDGRFLVSTSGDNYVKLADTLSRNVEQIHTSSRRTGSYAAFAADGRTIVVVQNDGVVRLWEPRPQRHLHRVPDLGRSVLCIQHSSDGRWLAIGGGDMHHDPQRWSIDLRDSQTGELVRRLVGHRLTVSALAFSLDGRVLASASYDETVRLWDTETGLCERTLGGHGGIVCGVALSPDGRFLATGGSDSNVRLWDRSSGDGLHTFTEHNRRVPQVLFSPDGQLLASCDIDARITVRDVSTRETLWSAQPSVAAMRTMAFSPDGTMLASAGDDRMIRLWNARDGRFQSSWEGHGYDIFALAFHRDGRILASAGRGPDIKLWEAQSGKHLLSFEGHDAEVYALSFHPDGQTLASGGADEMLGLWDLTYYHGHIARNLEFQIRRLSSQETDAATITRLRAWASGVVQRPWPRYPWRSEGVHAVQEPRPAKER